MTPLRMPLSLPLWELASLEASRPQMRALLGEPHFVETDSTRTAGGEEDGWAYILPSGQRVLIILGVPYCHVRLIADPPELGPVLAALEITLDDPRLHCNGVPYPLD
jgi:hypothetical protein